MIAIIRRPYGGGDTCTSPSFSSLSPPPRRRAGEGALISVSPPALSHRGIAAQKSLCAHVCPAPGPACPLSSPGAAPYWLSPSHSPPCGRALPLAFTSPQSALPPLSQTELPEAEPFCCNLETYFLPGFSEHLFPPPLSFICPLAILATLLLSLILSSPPFPFGSSPPPIRRGGVCTSPPLLHLRELGRRGVLMPYVTSCSCV